jgi:hypothetical protein
LQGAILLDVEVDEPDAGAVLTVEVHHQRPATVVGLGGVIGRADLEARLGNVLR